MDKLKYHNEFFYPQMIFYYKIHLELSEVFYYKYVII